MANSREKDRERRRDRKIPNHLLFARALGDLRKQKNTENISCEQFKSESESQNSDSSKNISNEQTCHGKPLPSDDKPYEDQNNVSPDYIMRMSRPRSHNSSRSSDDNHTNTRQDKQSHEIPDKLKCNFSNSDFDNTSDMKTLGHNSKSKLPVSSNIYQEKLHNSAQDNTQKCRNTKFINSSTYSGEYHMNTQIGPCNERSRKSNSDILRNISHFDSSCMKNLKHNSNSKHFDSINTPKDFSKETNFKQFSNFQKSHFKKNNNKTDFNSIQCHNSCKNNLSFSKSNFNSDFECQDKVKLSCKLKDPNTQMPDEKKDYVPDNKLNSENNFNDDTTQIRHQRVCLEKDEFLKDTNEKNLKITVILPTPDPVAEISPLSSSSLMLAVSNPPISSVLSTSAPSISSSSVSSISNISSELLTSNVSSVSSCLSASKTISNFNNDNTGLCISSDDSFIPAPVSIKSCVSNNAEKNETFLQNNESESAEGSYADEVYFSLPDSKHLQAISNFILKVVKERSASKSSAYRVISDLNRLFKHYFEGNVIECYGSYETGLAITTSNINLMIQPRDSEVSIKKSFMFEIHKILSGELERYHVSPFEEGISAYRSKIIFTHPDTGINCELVYLGKYEDKFLEMGKFLKNMCYMDYRVRSLIIAAKVWAEYLNINDVEDGKLHSIGFALLVIHFLQHSENPILPIYSYNKEDASSYKQDYKQENITIGELWLEFLRYYAFTFNWQEDILTVTSVSSVSKKSKKWENYWIAIQDPFTNKNIAESVTNKDVADSIISCFRQSYYYFWNGPEDIPSFDYKEDQSNAKYCESELEFSFNDCIVEQEENICEICDEINDVCDECKKKIYVQPMASVPKMTDDFLKIIKKAILTAYKKYILSDEEVHERKQFVKRLEHEVRRMYPEAQMSLFGSSANGFGFKKSDLDVCMTFKSKQMLKPFAVLRDLRYLLRKDKNFVNVIAIFNARIPILKFRYEPLSLCGDISLDNVLAVHNSELLYTYSLIDERCKILGCILKLIAKKAFIAEVTEKALSSYSYLIMVIHFLQQTDPPVLPVLQDNQFRENNFELDHIVDNCNVWFCQFDDIKKTFKPENETPVEQLFLELIDYYCSFDCKQVITIRQKEILPICEKIRTARLFNIQDPFLVTKNLGCVVSPTKAQETKSVLARARKLFRTPKKELPVDLEDYFFSTMNLTGRFQKEALCEFCGKFGHDQKDCSQSSFTKKVFFRRRLSKYIPRQYANQNAIILKKQMNRQNYIQKL